LSHFLDPLFFCAGDYRTRPLCKPFSVTPSRRVMFPFLRAVPSFSFWFIHMAFFPLISVWLVSRRSVFPFYFLFPAYGPRSQAFGGRAPTSPRAVYELLPLAGSSNSVSLFGHHRAPLSRGSFLFCRLLGVSTHIPVLC